MNKLSKIAPIIVILACAGSLFFTFRLGGIKTKLKDDNAQLTQERDSTRRQLAATETQLKATKTQLQQTEADLATANTNLQNTTAALAQKTQEADGLKTQVAERDQQLEATKAELASAKGVLEKIQESLKAVGIENVQNIDQIRQRIASLGEESKALSDQLRKMRDENQQLKDKVVELSTTPANLRGRVASVQDKWNFLVLDIGQQQQVRKNAQFLIYRDNKPVGNVQVVSVGPTTSIAEILPGSQRGTPRVGDVAVH
jgi:chromosome segregation ATPase